MYRSLFRDGDFHVSESVFELSHRLHSFQLELNLQLISFPLSAVFKSGATSGGDVLHISAALSGYSVRLF